MTDYPTVTTCPDPNCPLCREAVKAMERWRAAMANGAAWMGRRPLRCTTPPQPPQTVAGELLMKIHG